MTLKAQIQQVFIYIMALLVIGFLVIVAVKLGGKLTPQACEVENTQFLSNFKKAMDQAQRYGTVAHPSVSAPCQTTVLCVLDADQLGQATYTPVTTIENMDSQLAVITSGVRENVPYNVYLVEKGKNGITTPVLLDERINTGDNDIICLEARAGAFDFWVKGLGRDGILIYEQ